MDFYVKKCTHFLHEKNLRTFLVKKYGLFYMEKLTDFFTMYGLFYNGFLRKNVRTFYMENLRTFLVKNTDFFTLF